jgi:hypothetical protein
MRPLFLLIGCTAAMVLSGVVACSAPATANQNSSGTVIDFSGAILYSPEPATAQTQTTLTFSVINSSTTGTTVTNFPFSVTLTNVSTGVVQTNFGQGVIPSIAPGVVVSQSFIVQVDQGDQYTFTILLDPNSTTGFADPSDQSQSTTITFAPSGSG